MKKLFILLLLSIFVVPLSSLVPVTGTDVWYVQYLGMLVIFGIGVALTVWDLNKFLSAFILVCLFSTLYTAQQHPRSILCMFQINFGCLGMYVISKFTKKQKNIILKTLFGLVLLQGVWVLLQFFNLDPIFDNLANHSIDDTVGFSGSRNQIGSFFAITSPLVLYVFPPAIFLTLAGLYGSTTTTSMVAFGASCLLYTRFVSLKIFFTFLFFLLIGSAIFFTKFESPTFSGKIQERLNVASYSMGAINSGQVLMTKTPKPKHQTSWIKRGVGDKKVIVTTNPIIGYGLGNFMRISPYHQNSFISSDHRYAHAHNDYVEFIFETGKMGTMVLLLLIIDFFWRFIRSKKTPLVKVCFCALIAQMVCSLGVYTVHTAVTGMLLIIFYGIYLGETNGKIT